jgi:hypothetical protein
VGECCLDDISAGGDALDRHREPVYA